MQTNYENARMLDMIFENRNKSYGAYALRNDYNRRISQALLITFTCIALLVFGKFISDRMSSYIFKDAEPGVIACPGPPIYLKPEPTPEPPKQPKQAPKAQPVPTKKNTEFNVVVKNPDTDTVLKVEQLKDVESGLATNINENPLGITDGTGTEKPGNEAPHVTEVEQGPPPFWVDTMPQFPGGEEKLLAFLRNKTRYPDTEQGVDVEGKALVKFVVNENGSISNVKVVKSDSPGFGREAVRVVGLMPHFIPGSQAGRRVKVQMVLPFQFKLAD